MSDLVEFLTARLDEDEAAAKALIGGEWTGGWEICRDGEVRDSGFEPRLLKGVIHDRAAWRTVDTERSRRARAEAAHIARHDPVRVLRDVEADRELLIEYERAKKSLPSHYKLGYCEALEEAIAIRAARFSDHPDYKEGWKS